MKCPICQGTNFKTYNTRPNAQCRDCGSLERGRSLWMALQKLELPRSDQRILHLAPEKFLMDRFAAHPGGYVAADIKPELYANAAAPVVRLDLCEDLGSFESDSFGFILHNHVLEHVPCSIDYVLSELARLLNPGGSMVFTVPTRAIEVTEEDLDPTLPPEERTRRFAQSDHMRIFGRDIIARTEKILGSRCFVPMIELFSKDEIVAAGVQWWPDKEPHGNSIFHFVKPPHAPSRARSRSSTNLSSAPNANAVS